MTKKFQSTKFQNNAVIFAESSFSGFRLAFVIGPFFDVLVGTRHLPKRRFMIRYCSNSSFHRGSSPFQAGSKHHTRTRASRLGQSR